MSDYQPTPPQSTPYTGGQPVAPSPILSILALVFGILGAVVGWTIFGGLPAIAGIILGFLGRRREPNGRGLALGGIITGFIGLAEAIIVIVLYIIAIVAIASYRSSAG